MLTSILAVAALFVVFGLVRPRAGCAGGCGGCGGTCTSRDGDDDA